VRPSHCYFMLIVLNKGENIKRRLQTIRPDSIPVGFSFYASGKSCGNQCLLLQICHCVIDCFCYCAALSRAVLNVAIRPSAPHLRFSKNTKVVETSNLVEMWCWTRENFRSKGQRSMSLGTVKFVFFSRISSSKVDRFTSNQDQNDHRPILYISLNIFRQRKCFVLWYFSNPGGPCRSGHLAVHMYTCYYSGSEVTGALMHCLSSSDCVVLNL